MLLGILLDEILNIVESMLRFSFLTWFWYCKQKIELSR